MLQVSVVSSDSPLDIRALAAWLAESPELRQAGVRIVDHGSSTGEVMGPVQEVVELVLAPDGMAVALASALGAWAATRCAPTRIRLRFGDKEVEVDAPSSRKAEEIAKAVLRGLDAE